MVMIDAAVLAWLRLSFIEQQYTGVFASAGGVTFERAMFWEKRMSAAHKRFNNAVVSLARVRKLMRPKVRNQVNIGEVNLNAVAGIRKIIEASKAGDNR